MGEKTTNRKSFSQREDLTGEHKAGDMGQILFALLFFAVWTVDSFLLGYTTFSRDLVSPWIRIPLGIVIVGFSAYAAWAGLQIIFGEVREKPSVIRKGIFNFVRHPIYLSELLLYFGLTLTTMSFAAFAIMVCAGIFLYYISRFEEKLLLQRFGNEYEIYLQEVGMWIPRFSTRRRLRSF